MLSRSLSIFCLLVTLIATGQETKFRILNTSINSPDAELRTYFVNDETILYASSKKVEEDEAFKKTRRKRQRQLSLALYTAEKDENGNISHSNRFLTATQGYIRLADFTRAPDRKTIYFTWNNYFPYMIQDTIPNYWSNLKIVKGTLNEEREIDISNAAPLSFVNDKNNFHNPALSPDGKTLYFVADLPRGYGGMDLYKVAIQEDGSFSEPQNLGPEINSSQDELFPYVDTSNTLYFSSYGHRGMGGLDIFRSKPVNGSFTTLEKMEAPINSKRDDFGIIINPSTQKGYLTSNRSGGQGDVDIYFFEPDIPECFQNIIATIVDSNTSKPLNNLQVSVVNDAGETINSMYLSEFTPGSIPIKCESLVTLRIEKEAYETLEVPFQTGDTYIGEIPKEFRLVALPCTQLITGDILHKLELNPIIDATVSLFVNDTLYAEKQITGSNSFSLEIPCDTEYRLTVDKNAFETSSTSMKSGKKYKDVVSKNILLMPKICAQSIHVAVFDSEASSEVSRFKTRLLSNGISIDEKNIVNGNKFSFDLNCENTYTVEIEKEGFEPATFSIATDGLYDIEHKKDVRLQPIPCTQFVTLEGTSELDKKALAAANIVILRDGFEIGTTSSPLDKIQLPCYSNIALEISSPGFVTKTLELKTTAVFEYVREMRVTFDPYICEQEIELSVADDKTKTGLTTYNIEISDGSSIKSKYVRKGSTATVTLKCDTNYHFKIEQDGYEPTEFDVATSSFKGETLSKTVFLTPEVCEEVITGQILDRETGSALSDALVTISIGNTFSQNLKLDKNGTYSFTANCSETYVIKASLLNYDSREITVYTSTNNGDRIEKTIRLQKDLEFTIVNGKRMINTDNIVFDLNKTEITQTTAIELNKVAALLKKYPGMSLLVKSHTDSRAPDQLNLNLTENRANSIKEYLTSQGIDSLRIVAKGMGETELLNKCSNNVKCSDEDHKKNRRTEFIVSN